MNSKTQKIDSFKYLNLPGDVEITYLNFGPFDNNYLLLGLSNGVLLGLDIP